MNIIENTQLNTLENDLETGFQQEKKADENEENYALIWSETLTILAKKIRKITFTTWIAKLKLKNLSADLAVIEVRNEFTKNFIEQSYIRTIQEALKEVTAKSYALKLEVIETQQNNEVEEALADKKSEQKTLANLPKTSQTKKTKINTKISIDKTYLGEFNKNCFNFASSVLQDTSGLYSSLFIYADSGLGKSHFLNLLANEFLKTNASAKVKYLSSERFINELIMAIQKNSTKAFRDKYRDLDLLLFDDFQYLENKKTCQEEFVHTFESITERGGKVIIAANKKFTEIKQLNKKLSSILKSSLISTIQNPYGEDKEKLIDFKVKELQINLIEKQKELIYKTNSTCIRDLEGSLLQLSALQKFSGLEVDNEEISKIFETSYDPEHRGLSIEKIISEVAKYFYIEEIDLQSKKRNEEFTKARHIAIYLSHKLLGLSYKKIGSYFSNRRHSSIIHSIKTVENTISTKLPSAQATAKALEAIKQNLI